MHLLEEKKIYWEEFHKHFKSHYLSECYYVDHVKEFHDIRLGQLTIDEFVEKDTNLLWYEKKAKVQ